MCIIKYDLWKHLATTAQNGLKLKQISSKPLCVGILGGYKRWLFALVRRGGHRR